MESAYNPGRPMQATILLEQPSRALTSLQWTQRMSKKRYTLFLQSAHGSGPGNAANLGLQNLWDGIDTYAAMIASLTW
jgi:hypothetical protein